MARGSREIFAEIDYSLNGLACGISGPSCCTITFLVYSSTLCTCCIHVWQFVRALLIALESLPKDPHVQVFKWHVLRVRM